MINVIQSLYDFLNIGKFANQGDVWGVFSILYVFIFILFFLITARKKDASRPEIKNDSLESVSASEPDWRERLKRGLSRSRNEVWGKLEKIFSGSTLDADSLDEIEELLYGADIGTTTVSELINELQKNIKTSDFSLLDFKKLIYEILKNKMESVQKKADLSLYDFKSKKSGKMEVIMVVGVNGAGKTTTIGKLATKLTRQGATVVVGACDTFRAAAVEQLKAWSERAGAKMVQAKEGANPSGVAYDALRQAIEVKADYCILDTAGRLHTKSNLMEELKKTKKVLGKLDASAPTQTLLVIDAITGQNALRQAEEFNKSIDLTGLIFTKCDSSSKAGGAVGIAPQLNVPVVYIGVGETVEDLNIFNLEEYLGTLLDI